MKNYPKYLNTKEDFINCLQLFPDRTKKHLQVLLNEVKNWILIDRINNEGTTDATHKVIEVIDEETNVVKERYQYEFKDDPNCELFRLGFTIIEVEELIK